ncbi:TatD family hydrolase [Lacibacter sp. H375]|uniref:TatD family hydrolase n=1 Tax=Lacibacter sp. H375 TaxID=3133424 RepID=UPI0030BC29AE
MEIIDTHAHLYLEDFQADIEDVLDRAKAERVTRFYLPNIDSSSIDDLLKLEKTHPECIPMMGLHPCSVKENVADELKLVEEWLQKRPFAAVGEIGLDYYWDKTFVAEQKEAFRKQINWALELNLPIVIHSRDSMQDCIDLVKEQQNGKLHGIFHCFGGSVDEAKKIMDLGFLMGIGGVVSYKKSGLAEVLTSIPLEYLVLETDAPYLTPVPFRGKRNEPSYLKYVITKMSEAMNIPAEEIAAQTTRNAQKLFGS